MSKRRIESAIATLFGGRIAEELIFGRDAVTTGASNDIERATDLARNMVTKWGLSDKLGPPQLYRGSGRGVPGAQRHAAQAGVGRNRARHRRGSSLVIQANYNSARTVLQDNIERLHAMADALMKYETIDDSQIREIMEGKPPTPPEGWDSSGLGGGSPGSGATVPPQRLSVRQRAALAEQAGGFGAPELRRSRARPHAPRRDGRAQCHRQFLFGRWPLRFLEAAVAHGIAMVESGASIIDIGGESTRPGAQPVAFAGRA